MNEYEKVRYIKFPGKDFDVTKSFLQDAFGWELVDYGPECRASAGERLDGGFFRSDQSAIAANGSALLVFDSRTLEQTQSKVESAGGPIINPIFAFARGQRFQFMELSGNEFAVWSNQ